MRGPANRSWHFSLQKLCACCSPRELLHQLFRLLGEGLLFFGQTLQFFVRGAGGIRLDPFGPLMDIGLKGTEQFQTGHRRLAACFRFFGLCIVAVIGWFRLLLVQIALFAQGRCGRIEFAERALGACYGVRF
jgi:hypothetical protein